MPRKSAKDKTPASAKEQEAPKSKEAILAAALRVFASDGYDGSSMPKIAKAAGVAAPLIHYYFQSKENLWRETVIYSLDSLRRDAVAIGSATRSLAPMDRMRVLLQTITQHAARWPDNFVMIIAEARSHSDRFSWVQEHYTGIIFQQFQLILQEGKDKGVFKDINIDQLASLLVGGIFVYFTANPAMVDGVSDQEIELMSNDYTDLVYNLLLDGICTKK